ncbi:MAG: hypothetical protein MJ252_04965, partial [archaeon]|nr:hypothetical protein [archaeon]
MFFGSNKDKPENQLPQYTKSQDNMRYGTYTDPKFEETLQNPVTDATLKEAFKNVEDGLDEFLPAFKDTIAKDTNSINEHSMEFDKKTIRYYLATSELKNLILAAHQKYFPSEAKLKDYVSPEKVADNYLKELSDFKPEVKNQYKDDCRAKIKREVGFSFKKAKEILDSKDKPGKTLMQNTLNFIDNRISDLFEKMKAFQSLESYENEDSDTFKKNQIVLLDFLIALQKIYTMAIAVSYSFKTPENDLYNLEPNAKEWEPLKSKYERITFPDDLERIKKQNEEDVEKYQKTMTVLSNNCFDTDSDAMKAWNLTKFGVLKDKTDLGME